MADFTNHETRQEASQNSISSPVSLPIKASTNGSSMINGSSKEEEVIARIEELAESIEKQLDLKHMVFPAENRTDYISARAGYSTEGPDYQDIKSMWKAQLVGEDEEGEVQGVRKSPLEGRAEWYQKGLEYWDNELNCTPDSTGVLGGFPELAEPDIRDSNEFLDEIIKIRPELEFNRVADVGAGVGRVVRDLLLARFQFVDLVEQSPRLAAAAPGFVGPRGEGRCSYLCLGAQDYEPEANSLDCIWAQWCIMNLTDIDYVDFLRKSKRALKPGGIVIIKDNCCEDEAFVVDGDDNSITRCAAYQRSIIRSAGLRILVERLQTGFPSDLYPVHMFCLVA